MIFTIRSFLPINRYLDETGYQNFTLSNNAKTQTNEQISADCIKIKSTFANK